MNNGLKRSELIKDRLLQVLAEDELMIGHEVEIVEAMCRKLNLQPMTEAAKALGISYNGLKLRIQKEQVITVNINGLTLISTRKEEA